MNPWCSVECLLLLNLVRVTIRYCSRVGLLLVRCHDKELLTTPRRHILLALMALNLLNTAGTLKLNACIRLGCLEGVRSNTAPSFSFGCIGRS